jgi:hypothetical protein
MLENFKIDAFYKEAANKKIAAYVLWITVDEGRWIATDVAEVVDTFIEGNTIEEGFQSLKDRVTGFASDAKLDPSTFLYYRNDEPGCNFAIFTVAGDFFKYQLNFVEIY